MLVSFGYEFINNYVDNLSRVEPSDISKAVERYLGQRKFLAMAAVPSTAEEN